MLDFPRWKIRAIIGGLVLLMLLAVPSFVPEGMRATWPKWVPQPVINLGLDLAGGSYLLLEGDTAKVTASKLETMSGMVEDAMKKRPRIDIGEISVAGGKVSFLVRDQTKVDEVRERLLPLTASGGFGGAREWDIEVFNSTNFVVTPTADYITKSIDTAVGDTTEVVRKRIDEMGTREPTIIRQGNNRIVVQVPGLRNPQALKELIGKTAKLEFKLVDETATDPAQLAAGQVPIGSQVLPYQEGGGLIAVKNRVIVAGEQLISASQGFEPQTNRVIVNFSFDASGAKKFAKVTQENTGKRFAIIVDDKVISAPVINTPILGGSGYIQGSFTVESANTLAIALRSGKLSVPLKVVQESTVSPELGQDSINAGVTASIIAAVAVIVFMILTYGRFGIYATIAVVINVMVILAAMALLSATLTLPGIAGFVLTIGTAVDANVLINERIREERRRGRSVTQSIELGYKEASRTIFEANMTHAIAGLIMWILGSGPVKGFATVLLIGIATSVFTAVVFTRMLVSIWVRRNRPTEIHI